MPKSGWLLILLAIAILIIGVLVSRGLIQNNQGQRLDRTAERLGYKSDAKIAQVNICWDIFAHCGEALYYRTGLSQDAFAQSIAGLSWETVTQGEIEGSEIFTDINLNTSVRISVKGQDPLTDHTLYPPFSARRWRLRSPDGVDWTVSYYPLALQPGPFALNGEALTDNIISILYQTK